MVDPAIHHAVLLWDLDNVTPGNRLMLAFTRTLGAAAGPRCPMFAAGHQGVCQAVRDDLTAAGVAVLTGARRRDGADRALLHLAHTLAQHRGTRHFLVASNDHAFAHLPKAAAVTVLTLHPGLVSARLRARAQAVITLVRPRGNDHAPPGRLLALGERP